tara:strand:- start:150 stop:461 length:312 start_codon:yes stop_codon:yes gene_type:complete
MENKPKRGFEVLNVYKDGVKQKPAYDYIYDSYWQAGRRATSHTVRFTETPSEGENIVIQYMNFDKELWRNQIRGDGKFNSYEFWTDNRMQERNTSYGLDDAVR